VLDHFFSSESFIVFAQFPSLEVFSGGLVDRVTGPPSGTSTLGAVSLKNPVAPCLSPSFPTFVSDVPR